MHGQLVCRNRTYGGGGGGDDNAWLGYIYRERNRTRGGEMQGWLA